MFQHFIVKNFRGFAGVHLQNLNRVNLIAGKNNTGKTALLEAINLHNHPNDCQLPLSMNKPRGIEEPVKVFSDILGWLFYGKQPEAGLEISSIDDKGINRTLSMFVLDAPTTRERFPEAVKLVGEAASNGFGYPVLGGLVLRYEQTGEPPRISLAQPSQWGGVVSITSRIPWSIASIYLGSGIPSPEQDMKFFGELEVAKREAEVIPALQILEPRLQRIALAPLASSSAAYFSGPTFSGSPSSGPMSSLSPMHQAGPAVQASAPILHGDIGLPRLIPIPFMGEGMRRVLSIVLALANAPGGVVLIDEIENGLHYSVQKDVWRAIAHAARQANAQVFATTHSWECIQAAHHAFKESPPYDLRYYRLDRRGVEVSVKSLDERMLDTVEKSDLEVR